MNPDADVVPVTPDMAVTETLGGYDLLRRLGAGGMAEVHLARHNAIEGFQKLVVLKQILPHLSRDRHFVRMFLGEARVAALLDHPNIVQVFDLGIQREDYYFTMEFVYGENLTGLLNAMRKGGQPLPIESVLTIARGAACGLHYAHERVGFDGRPLGIVHRDVSPTNVMITYEGGVKMADFGIAKVITRTDVTRAGIRKGKVPYMSPEQCRAEPIDRRSDIFSLGIVMHEMVTGERLFEGDNEFGVMNTIVNGTIGPPSLVRSDVPQELDRIIGKALARDKNERYQTARELQLDLEVFARDARLRASESALGEMMHHLFRPQPFPWGALMGDGLSDAAHLHPGTHSSQRSGVEISTPPSQVGLGAGAPTTGSGSSIEANVARGTVITTADGRSTTLRGIAIGLVAVAGVAAALVLGLWLGGRGVGGLGQPAGAAVVAPASAAPQAPGQASVGADDAPAPAPPASDEALRGAADQEDEQTADTDEAPVDQVIAEPLVIGDEPPPRKRRKKKPAKESAPAGTKNKKKKLDPDAFMPGL